MRHQLILNFHGIGAPHAAIGSNERGVWMSKERFVDLLDGIVDLRECSHMPILITFDDGNESDAEIALPELIKRGFNATFFICSGRIGSPKYLDRQSITELLSAGMKVGTHGMHHVDWRRTSAKTLHDEITMAREEIQSACGRPVTEAAIPFGSYDRRVLTNLKKAGFEQVYTSDRGLAHRNAWLKPRNTLLEGAVREDISGIIRDAGPLGTLLRDLRMTLKGARTGSSLPNS